jgi:hypothetical protein
MPAPIALQSCRNGRYRRLTLDRRVAASQRKAKPAGGLGLRHKRQPVANRRNSARSALYLAARRVLSHPCIRMVPLRSRTCHSHLVGLRSTSATSNMVRTYRQYAARPCGGSKRQSNARLLSDPVEVIKKQAACDRSTRSSSERDKNFPMTQVMIQDQRRHW